MKKVGRVNWGIVLIAVGVLFALNALKITKQPVSVSKGSNSHSARRRCLAQFGGNVLGAGTAVIAVLIPLVKPLVDVGTAQQYRQDANGKQRKGQQRRKRRKGALFGVIFHVSFTKTVI